jgi:hypothetical protein
VNVTQGRDAIFAQIKTTLDADPISAPVKVLYWDVGQDVPRTQDALTKAADPYFVAIVGFNGGGQATLADQNGQTKFDRRGIVTLQIHAPFGTGQNLLDQFIEIGLRCFEGQNANGAWFRNVRPIDVGQRGQYFRTNIIADFEFDQLR